MSDIKLFRLSETSVEELSGKSAQLEKHLQNHVEANMETLIGVRFLAGEYSTGKTHKGRIDSLGLDENGCPVIVEYKRHNNENIINQGLFYLDWLLDHQAEFKWLVMEKIGKAEAENIEWSGTRLIAIASDFNKYDEHAVQQINRNIELMRYRYFGNELLLLELVNAQTANQAAPTAGAPLALKKLGKNTNKDKSQQERLTDALPELLDLFHTACGYTEQLGDEVQRKELKLYTAFKSIRNFVSIVVQTGKDSRLQMYLKLPGSLGEETIFSRDVTNIGHWGTGNLEVNVRTAEDWEKARILIERAYQES
jgi:predicted transport protein